MRFYKDSQKIYFDSAKAGPMYYELLDWRNKYEKNSLIKKSQIRESHKAVSYTHLTLPTTPYV